MAMIPMILVGPADDYRENAAESFGYGVFTGFLALLDLSITLGSFIRGNFPLMMICGFTVILLAIVCAMLMRRYVAAMLMHKQALNAKSVAATERLIAAVNKLELSPNDHSKEE